MLAITLNEQTGRFELTGAVEPGEVYHGFCCYGYKATISSIIDGNTIVVVYCDNHRCPEVIGWSGGVSTYGLDEFTLRWLCISHPDSDMVFNLGFLAIQAERANPFEPNSEAWKGFQAGRAAYVNLEKRVGTAKGRRVTR